jgi:rhodanese-related sulfurtransferase
MQKKGWTLLDVRVDSNFENSHIEGAVSVPLYRGVQGRQLFDQIKRFTMASLAMTATGEHVHVLCCLSDAPHVAWTCGLRDFYRVLAEIFALKASDVLIWRNDAERDPDFADKVLEKFGKQAKIIVVRSHAAACFAMLHKWLQQSLTSMRTLWHRNNWFCTAVL